MSQKQNQAIAPSSSSLVRSRSAVNLVVDNVLTDKPAATKTVTLNDPLHPIDMLSHNTLTTVYWDPVTETITPSASVKVIKTEPTTLTLVYNFFFKFNCAANEYNYS